MPSAWSDLRNPVYVLFDGDCATCHFVVKALLRRRGCERFRFVSLRDVAASPWAEAIHAGLGRALGDSVLVVRAGVVSDRSDAMIVLAEVLGGFWHVARLLALVPRPLRDVLYDLYARNRYLIAGKAREEELCMLIRAESRRLLVRDFDPGFAVFARRRGVFLTASWRMLVMVNYEVPREVLEPLVPVGTELDDHDGRVLVSVVGFLFADARVKGLRAPGFTDFEEVNLRFYVRRTDVREDGFHVKRGVVFVKEIVPNAIVAGVARVAYGGRYVARPMWHRVGTGDVEGSAAVTTVTYGWREGAGECSIGALFEGEATLPEPGSIEEFITEHYWGYARRADGTSVEYEVEHPRWRVWHASRVEVNGPLAAAYGEGLTAHLQEPHSAFVAEGSDVRVFEGRRLTPPRN